MAGLGETSLIVNMERLERIDISSRLYLSHLLCTIQYGPMILLPVASDKEVECCVKMGRELNKSQAKQIRGTRAIWLVSGQNNFSPYHLFLTRATALIHGKIAGGYST